VSQGAPFHEYVIMAGLLAVVCVPVVDIKCRCILHTLVTVAIDCAYYGYKTNRLRYAKSVASMLVGLRVVGAWRVAAMLCTDRGMKDVKRITYSSVSRKYRVCYQDNSCVTMLLIVKIHWHCTGNLVMSVST
jgi:hypothetical protein